MFCLLIHLRYGLVLGKVRRGLTDGRTCGGVLQMRWLLRRLGIRRPHERRVITPTHEGVVSSVWQSSHNSGFIHHMGIMLLTGTTPKKSYTRSSPASESLNNPIPLLSTHCVWLERDRPNEQELLHLKEKTLILGRVRLWRQLIYVQWKMLFTLFLCSSPNNFGVFC